MRAFTCGRRQPGDTFYLDFNPCVREPKTWKEEIYAAAKLLANRAGSRPIWLASSGGTDSEVMCRAFFDQGINFSVLTVEHIAGTNRHDTAYARAWCRARAIPQKIVELDMPAFLSNDVFEYTRKEYVTGNVYRYFQIRLLEEIDRLGGFGVIGSGEQLYQAASGAVPYLEYEVGIMAPLQWSERHNTEHEPFFYMSTPEIYRSYMDIPIIARNLHYRDIFIHRKNAFLLKRIATNAVWDDLRDRPKFTGYEHIRPHRLAAQKKLRGMFGDRIQTLRIPVDEVRNQLDARS
ncbi:MAG: hypothetical protein HYS26_01085 [Candidatus Kaiserbacteria bacterium]|nr:MAG: hypothetical protein HYS26_01085 [Candidatus Kaiserbacteria bacterium]